MTTEATSIDQAASVESAVKDRLDDLILAATATVVKLSDSAKMEESQLRNLSAVAEENPMSVLAVTMFVRYQIGRDTRRETWGSGGFGMSVIHDIEQGVIPSLVKSIMDTVPGANKARVRGRLIAVYAGYLARAFVYARKAIGWDNLDKLIKQMSGETNAE